jgi:hypothetical protein
MYLGPKEISNFQEDVFFELLGMRLVCSVEELLAASNKADANTQQVLVFIIFPISSQMPDSPWV